MGVLQCNFCSNIDCDKWCINDCHYICNTCLTCYKSNLEVFLEEQNKVQKGILSKIKNYNYLCKQCVVNMVKLQSDLYFD